jgi:hypothetical protein
VVGGQRRPYPENFLFDPLAPGQTFRSLVRSVALDVARTY